MVSPHLVPPFSWKQSVHKAGSSIVLLKFTKGSLVTITYELWKEDIYISSPTLLAYQPYHFKLLSHPHHLFHPLDVKDIWFQAFQGLTQSGVCSWLLSLSRTTNMPYMLNSRARLALWMPSPSQKMASIYWAEVSQSSSESGSSSYCWIGNDKHVRIWNLKTLKCEQSLQSDKWGQITTLMWAMVDPPIDGPYVSICVGTGRGAVTLCLMSSETILVRVQVPLLYDLLSPVIPLAISAQECSYGLPLWT